jgi:hypothetical protein
MSAQPRSSALRRRLAPISLDGQTFAFALCQRTLNLGQAGDLRYFWMDSRALRQQRGQVLAPNFASCLGHWWAALRSQGLDHDVDQQVHLVLARCYPLVCQAKSLQDVYLDAHLASAESGDADLPPALSADELAAIQVLGAQRERAGVKQMLDEVLARTEPRQREMPAFREALRHWIGNGVVALRKDNLDWRAQPGSHLAHWLAQVQTELREYRRRGGQPRVRQFANLFAYQTKVSFFTCFSNAWIDLIPWLRQHQSLTALEERFLRLWHFQNQPVEIPPGRTASGLFYPTCAGVRLLLPQEKAGLSTILWQVPRPGAAALPDVFTGQVLSLHPLSAVVMRDPILRTLVGRFLVAPEYETIMASRNAQHSAAYWGMVEAVVIAAALYRQQRQTRSQRRAVWLNGGEATCNLEGPDAALTERLAFQAFEDYAAIRKLRCGCGGRLHFQSHEPVPRADDRLRVHYRCAACSRTRTHQVTQEELREILLG